MFFDRAVPLVLEEYLGSPDLVTSQWTLLNTPAAIVTILGLYFSSILVLRNYMRTRKAYQIRGPLIVYNAFQVVYSAYICKEVFLTALFDDYKLTCTPAHTETVLGQRMANAFWFFYLSKVIDLADTIFFILRKKNQQITFLHIYHHASMIFNWYLGTLYSPGGQAFFSVMLNSFVHVIMYTYYLLAAMGPQMQKYLWWKRYLTQIQLVQFALIITHLIVGLYNRCKAPFWLNWFTIIYVASLVVLFGNFYLKAYRTATSKKLDSTAVTNSSLGISSYRTNNGPDVKAGGDYKYD